MRLQKLMYVLGITLFIQGCGSTKCLIENCSSNEVSLQVIELKPGEDRVIIKYKAGIMFGGYFPGLFSENPDVVEVSYVETKRGHVASIIGMQSGTAKVYFANRAGAGSVLRDSTERAFWLDQFEDSEDYFVVKVN